MLQPVRQNDLPFAKEPLLQREEFLDVVYICTECNILVKLCQGAFLMKYISFSFSKYLSKFGHISLFFASNLWYHKCKSCF